MLLACVPALGNPVCVVKQVSWKEKEHAKQRISALHCGTRQHYKNHSLAVNGHCLHVF